MEFLFAIQCLEDGNFAKSRGEGRDIHNPSGKNLIEIDNLRNEKKIIQLLLPVWCSVITRTLTNTKAPHAKFPNISTFYFIVDVILASCGFSGISPYMHMLFLPTPLLFAKKRQMWKNFTHWKCVNWDYFRRQ